jgi:hypothetical protein
MSTSKPTDRFSPSIPIANPRPAGGEMRPGNTGPKTPIQKPAVDISGRK